MRVFAIADLHLGLQVGKTMDDFGPAWLNHSQRITDNLTGEVTDEDLLLLPGDLSWALHLAEAKRDLEYISALPGKKLLLRGNHDYWWSSLSKIRQALDEWDISDIELLQNDAHRYGNIVVCGTRGWMHPDDKLYKKETDLPIFEREVHRLKLSLESAAKLRKAGDHLVAMMHYPPFGKNLLPTAFTQLLTEYGVEKCVFGHIHHRGPQVVKNYLLNDVLYSICACDQIDCRALRVI